MKSKKKRFGLFLVPGFGPFLIVFGRLFVVPAFKREREWIRGVFPQCYSVGFCSSDLGGQVYAWGQVFTWNKWHARHLYDSAAKSSDGIVWHPIALSEFFQKKVAA